MAKMHLVANIGDGYMKPPQQVEATIEPVFEFRQVSLTYLGRITWQVPRNAL